MFKNQKSTIRVKCPNTGKSLEETIREALESKQPLDKVSELIYTERKDGVQPQYDIRTDRFDIAVQAHDKYSKSQVAKREQYDKDGKPEIVKDEQGREHLGETVTVQTEKTE